MSYAGLCVSPHKQVPVVADTTLPHLSQRKRRGLPLHQSFTRLVAGDRPLGPRSRRAVVSSLASSGVVTPRPSATPLP